MASAYLAMTANRGEDSDCLYGALTRKNAKRIGWRALKTLNRKFNLGFSFHETDLIATSPTGSNIVFIGLEDKDAAEAVRGEKFKLIVLDECASYGPSFEYTIEEVLEPTLMDLQGTLAMVGTPGAACIGPFYDATEGEKKAGYSRHKWTLLENPFLPHAAAWLEEKKKRKGWSNTNPIYLREYRGLWVRNNSSLIYDFADARNLGNPENPTSLYTVMGVDLGYEDDTAIVVVGFSDDSPNLYVLDSFKKAKLLPAEVARLVEDFIARYKPVSIVADTGGLGKAIVEEMRVRYALPVRAAEKRNKYEYIELINSDFKEGRIKVAPNLRSLREELAMLQWDEDRRKIDDRFSDHQADALLYAWRECQHFGFRAREEKKPFGVQSFWDERIKKLEERLQQNESKNWWEK